MSTNHASDGIKWWPKVQVIKYGPETMRTVTKDFGHEPNGPELRMLEAKYGLTPDEITYAEGNRLVNNGLDRLANLITGTGAAFTSTQGFAGVGDSATADTVTDTALNAATNKWYQIIDGAPTVNTAHGQIAANCTLTSSNGNYAWNEWLWGIATGTITAGTTLPGASPTIINHKAQSLGTKVSGAVWTLQATITLS